MIARSVFFALLLILQMPYSAGQDIDSVPISPKDVLERFCTLDANGKQLNGDEKGKINRLFIQPDDSPAEKAIVIKDLVILNSSTLNDTTEFDVEYVYLGQLDLLSGTFSRLPSTYPPGPVKVRIAFNLIRSAVNSKTDSDETNKEKRGGSEWRIQGAPPQPRITVETAMRYVRSLQEKSLNGSTRKNTERTLIVLKRLKQ